MNELEKPTTLIIRHYDQGTVNRIVEVLLDKLGERLWDIGGRLHMIDGDRMVQIAHPEMSSLINKMFRTPQLAWRGGKPETYLAALDINQNNRQLITDIITTVMTRIGKAPQAPRELSYQQLEQIDYRLRSGEAPQAIASAYDISLTRVVELRNAQRG
jgi:hypothetical protein